MRLFLTFFAVSSAFIHRIGNVDLYNLLSLGDDETTTAAETTTTMPVTQNVCFVCTYRYNSTVGITEGSSDCLKPTEKTIETGNVDFNKDGRCAAYYSHEVLNGVELVYLHRFNFTQDDNHAFLRYKDTTDQNTCDGDKCNGKPASDFIETHDEPNPTTTKATTTTQEVTTTTEETTTLPDGYRFGSFKIGNFDIYADDETTTKAESTRQTHPTTTPKPEQCFICSQDNADDKGDCWDPANSDEQTLEVCEKGCYQYFTQSIMQLPGIDDPIVDSKVERLCNTDQKTDGSSAKFNDIKVCKGSMCNDYEYSSSLMIKLNIFLLLAMSLLL